MGFTVVLAAMGAVSCTRPVQPGASGQYVEGLEREAPVTPLSDVGQGQGAAAAAYYSTDRGRRYGYRNDRW